MIEYLVEWALKHAFYNCLGVGKVVRLASRMQPAQPFTKFGRKEVGTRASPLRQLLQNRVRGGGGGGGNDG